ncbi:MAG: nucleotide sugar dehydrogenase [Pararhizobium sp.]
MTAETDIPAKLLEKITARRARIAIIGMGYVGLPLAIGFHGAGFPVIGFDIDPEKVRMLNAGEPYIRHFSRDKLATLAGSGRFEATAEATDLSAADALIICVPTPLDRARNPDMSFVVGTARTLGKVLRRGQIVSLESTTWPGTTDDLLAPILEEESGLVAGRDFLVAYSPEREDPGNAAFETVTIPKVVGAADPASRAVAAALYGAVVPRVVEVSNAVTAEAVKLTENVFRSVNIALVNELKLIYERMGIDVWEVIDAAATKPFGYMPFYPGPGLGGHCIPIDPFYLAWRAREVGIDAKFVELAGEINRVMPDHVIARLADALGRRTGKALAAAHVLLIGVAYKKNVDDTRESPGLLIFERLREHGATVTFHDPHVAVIPPTREHAALAGERSVALDPATLSAADAVLIVTDHDAVDWTMVAGHARLVVDTRNVMARHPAAEAGRIVKA